jgi:hypothetical protein
MQENRAEKFRQQATECRRRAEQTAASVDKQTWLMLAEDWCKLAQAEDQTGVQQISVPVGRLQKPRVLRWADR